MGLLVVQVHSGTHVCLHVLLRSAYGIYINEVNSLLTKAVLELPIKSSTNQQQYTQQLKQNFRRLLPVLKNYIRSGESQHNCIAAIEVGTLLNFFFKFACVSRITGHTVYDPCGVWDTCFSVKATCF